MRYLTFIFLVSLSTALLADARIEVLGDFCHAPYENANVDNEVFLSGCGGYLVVRNGIATGNAVIHKRAVHMHALPEDVRVHDTEAYPSGKRTLRTSGEDSGTACAMVDSNGTEYSSGNWNVRIIAQRVAVDWQADVTYEITCWSGVPVAVE